MPKRILTLISVVAATAIAAAAVTLDWTHEVGLQTGSGHFAPYFMSAGRSGIIGVSPNDAYLRERLTRPLTDTTRFSLGYGIDLVGGYFSKISYQRYEPDGTWTRHNVGPGMPVVQQLYAEARYRSLYAMVGAKEYDRSPFNSDLGVGDFTLSRNARPIPGFSIGFGRFVDVPLTRGWLQLQGDIAYGKFTDDSWIRSQYNRYNFYIATGVWFHNKHLFVRTDPSRPLSVMASIQHAAQFGGTRYEYDKGTLQARHHNKIGLYDFIAILIPHEQPNGQYYVGNSVGTIDLQATYRFPGGTRLIAYYQHPWEDGSGMGFANGLDGIYALHYIAPQPGWLTEAMLTYVEMQNQSGPMHWDPAQTPGTAIHGQATGADNYYNNQFFAAWANYGMVLGTPFILSPIYNRDGYARVAMNRVRGFQAGIKGQPTPTLTYRALLAYKTGWGTPYDRSFQRQHATSAMLEAHWAFTRRADLRLHAALAFDAGNMYGTNLGISLGIIYRMSIKTGKK